MPHKQAVDVYVKPANKNKAELLSTWPQSAISRIIKSSYYGQKLFVRAQKYEINSQVCTIKQWNTSEKSDQVKLS